MLKIRLIPVLLLKKGRMVKPIRFGDGGERDVGDPKTTARIYDSQDADELLFLDIEAGKEGRTFLSETLKEVAQDCFVPLTAGGGIRSLDDFELLLRSGADKVSINTSAIQRTSLIREAATRFGSQCVVVSIDYKLGSDGRNKVFINRGREETIYEPVAWAIEVARQGAGEILLTSITHEGMMGGYDLETAKKVSEAVSIPVIINGGAGSRADFVSAVREAKVGAVAASSVFHFSDSNLTQVKSFMLNAGLPVRPI